MRLAFWKGIGRSEIAPGVGIQVSNKVTFIWAGLGLVYAAAIFGYWGDVLNPDTYFYIVFWKELIAGHGFHSFVVTTPKILPSALYGPAFLATQSTLGVMAIVTAVLVLLLIFEYSWIRRAHKGIAVVAACALILLSPDILVTALGANSALLAGLLVILAVQALEQSNFLPPLLIISLFLAGLARTEIWFLYPLWLVLYFWKNRRLNRRALAACLLWLCAILSSAWFADTLFKEPDFVFRSVGVGGWSKLLESLPEILAFPAVWIRAWARADSVPGLIFGMVGLSWLARHRPSQALFVSSVLVVTFVSNAIVFVGRGQGLPGHYLTLQSLLIFGAAGIGIQETIAWLVRQREPDSWLYRQGALARKMLALRSRYVARYWLIGAAIILIGLTWLTYSRSLMIVLQHTQQERVQLRAALRVIGENHRTSPPNRLLVPEQQMSETILRLGISPSEVDPWVYANWSGLTIQDLYTYDYVVYNPDLADPGSPTFFQLDTGHNLTLPNFELVPIYIDRPTQTFVYKIARLR